MEEAAGAATDETLEADEADATLVLEGVDAEVVEFCGALSFSLFCWTCFARTVLNSSRACLGSVVASIWTNGTPESSEPGMKSP